MLEQPGAGRLDPETLAAYIDGQLPPEERARVEAEIATDPESYEWVVNSINAVDDAAVVVPVEPVRHDAPAPVPNPEPAPTPLPSGGSGGGEKVLPFYRRRAVQGMLGTVLAAAAALVMVVRTQPVWWQDIWGPAVEPRFARLVEAVGEERYIEARLTGGFKYGPLREVTRGPGDLANQNLQLLAAAGELQKAAERDPSAASLHAWGVAQVLLGEFDAAVATLEDALADSESRSGSIASDLAAAHAARAAAGRDDDWPRVLEYAEKAIRDGSGAPELLFNRALALEALHLREQAIAAWQQYLESERDPDWARVARSAVARLNTVGSRPGWPLDVIAVEPSERAFAHLAALDAQRLREEVQDVLIPQWAAAVQSGDEATAQGLLTRVRLAAGAYLREAGDRSLVATAELLSHASGKTKAPAAEAFMNWRKGRREFAEDRMADMTRTFRGVAQNLPAGHPASTWALQYVATGLYYAGDLQIAERLLRELRAQTDSEQFVALDARLAWLQGTLAYQQARFEEASNSYGQAARQFARARERENTVVVTELLAESEAGLGADESSWTHGLSALGHLDDVRDARRRYSILAGAGTRAFSASPTLALYLYTAALPEARAFGSAGALVSALQNRARALFETGAREEAVRVLLEAEEATVAIVDPGVRARFRADMLAAKAAMLVESAPADAASAADQALADYRANASEYRLAGLSRVRARAYRAAGRDREAIAQLSDATAQIESKRALLSRLPLRSSFLDALWPVYQDLIEAQAASAGGEMAALKTVERARARSLLDSYSRGVMLEPVDPARLQSVMAANEAAIYLATLDARTLVWLIRADGVRHVELPLGRADLLRWTGRFRVALEQGRPAAVSRWARQLHEAVMEPISPHLAGVDHLIFIPDDAWDAVPFAVLLDVAGRHLVERYTIAIAPSASVLLAPKAVPSKTPLRAGAVFVAPGIGGTRTGLRGAIAEAAEIAATYGLSPSGVSSDPTEFLAALSQAEVVHFAGHAIADADQPWVSRLLFLGGAKAATVSSLDIEHVRSRADLVVLAACRTAAGSASRTEGVMSMARPFIAAGTRAVVASLWEVADATSVSIMAHMHREFRVGRSAPFALATAQRAAIRTGVAAHRWAAYEAIVASPSLGDATKGRS